MRLKDKVSIVTGGGSGIGREIACMFAREGSKVLICDIVENDGKETVKMIKAGGGQGLFINADVSIPEQVEAMMDFCVKNYSRLDILVNNAGIAIGEPYLATEVTQQAWDKIVGVDLTGVFLCCKYGIPRMKLTGGGSIVNISSVAGIVASERTAYGAAKGGVVALTKTLARQYARDNIRANAICPSVVDTPLHKKATAFYHLAQRPPAPPMLGRIGKPEDVAYAALYLASDEASWITAVILPVDGGATAM